MADFSISQALGSSLGIAARKPGVVLMWGLAYMAIAIGPLLLLGGMMVPAILAAAAGGEEPDPAAVAALMGPMMLLQPVVFIASIAAQAMLMGAVYRAVLEPENSRWAYLRLSKQELWLALVNLVVGVIVGFGVLVLMLPLAGIGAAAAVAAQQAMGEAGMVLALIPVFLIFAGAIVWLLLRLSMAFPMTFADRTFRLFESWSFTRGHTLRLFGLGLSAVLIGLVVEIILFLVAAAAVFGLFAGNFAALQSGDLAAMGAQLAGSGIIFVVLFVVLAGFMSLIVYGPFADAYRQLKASAA